MKPSRLLLVLALFALAILWLGFMSVLSALAAGLKGGGGAAPLEDGSLKATITNVERSKDFEITLSLKLTDKDGKLIEEGLTEQQFEIYEDNVQVGDFKFTAAGKQPLRLCLVIDFSSSMAQARKSIEARNAALALLRLLQDERDIIGVHFFNDSLFDNKTGNKDHTEILPLQPLNLERREKAWDAITLGGTDRRHGGLGNGSPMLGTMSRGLDKLATVSGRRVMIVMTDGMDTDKDELEANRRTVLDKCKALSIPLYMISTSSEAGDEPAMASLAEQTNGLYRRVTNPQELREIFLEVGKSLQNEYVISYDSPNPNEDGSTRKVKVIARSGKIGTTATKDYSVPGVAGAGGGKKAGGGSRAGLGSLAVVFGTFTAMLGVLFAVPSLLRFLSVPADIPEPPTAPAPSPPQAAQPRPTVPPAKRPRTQ